MGKVMPSFEYEPLVFSPKPQTLDEEEDKGDHQGQIERVSQLQQHDHNQITSYLQSTNNGTIVNRGIKRTITNFVYNRKSDNA